jgi:hypothetical protein
MADTPSTEAADMDAGYSDTPTETPAVATPEPTQPPVETVEPDPMKQLAERLDKFEATTNKLAGHIGGLTRAQQEIQQTLAASKVAASAAESAPTQAQVAEAIGSSKEWDALKEEYPEWASATEKLLDAKLATHKAPPTDDVAKTVEDKLHAQMAQQASKDRSDEISEIHPNWKADLFTVDAQGQSAPTADYAAWAKTMTPEEVAKFENSNSVLYVDRKLTQFYAWKSARAAHAAEAAQPTVKPIVSTRQKRLEAAVNPRGTGGHAAGGSSEIDEIEAGYSG